MMTASSARRWGLAIAGMSALVLAWQWGEHVAPTPEPDFTVSHWPMKVLFPLLCLGLVGVSLWALYRLFPGALPTTHWMSLAALPGALAGTAVLVGAFLASVGLARGVNTRLERPAQWRYGTVAGLGVNASDHQVTRVQLGELETLELGLPRLRALGLDVGSPVAIELHHGPLFTWGRAHAVPAPWPQDSSPAPPTP